MAEERARSLIILGDLTDAKDYHPAQLVNRVVHSFQLLRKAHPELRIYLLRGNHDYLKDGHMFFEFLGALGVQVITKPTDDSVDEAAYFLPYSKAPAAEWQGLDFTHYRWLFMHQTVKGAISSNGQEMDGEALPPLNAGKVYSGDIHVPQRVGPVEYVGSPYHVHFGDAFTPRCIALDHDGRAFDLHYPAPRRVTIDADNAYGDFIDRLGEMSKGDQVKVRLHLDEAVKHEWQEQRRFVIKCCAGAGVELHGLELKVGKTRRRIGARKIMSGAKTPAEMLYNFVKRDDLGGDLYDIGMEIIES